MTGFLPDLLARWLPHEPASPSLEQVVDLVDEVLAGLGIDGQREDSDDGADWSLQVGSATLELGLHHNVILDEDTLEVRSPILRLPERNLLAFYRRCLELNRIVVGCCFGVDEDVVVVATERTLPGLGKPEVARMLLDVASVADQFDDELAREFGAEQLGQAP
ncbi:YbjN domain-containing protein [Vulcanococcus limneticus]|uniref:YbjN domain-containing protein n=1 Tax=Vulcanococcus limneticus TaxID=2170428 RepID=UPI00398BEB2A